MKKLISIIAILIFAITSISYANTDFDFRIENKEKFQSVVKGFKKLAEQGDPGNQFMLATIYYDNQYYKQAAEWYTKAAVQDNSDDHQYSSDAQYNLGIMYVQGLGVERSDIKAISWFKKAAKNGNKDAQKILNNIGITY